MLVAILLRTTCKCYYNSLIMLYLFQILEALSFIHEKGLPYGHLHTGNILLTATGAKLLDVENGLLGLPAFYRPYVVQRRKLYATVSIKWRYLSQFLSHIYY